MMSACCFSSPLTCSWLLSVVMFFRFLLISWRVDLSLVHFHDSPVREIGWTCARFPQGSSSLFSSLQCFEVASLL